VGKISDLHPAVAELARELIIQSLKKENLDIVVTEGLRTRDYQDHLYALGRTKPGRVVTFAKGGESYHNYGLAFDVAMRDSKGRINWDNVEEFGRVGRLGEILGLEWGGRWKKKDLPHFQYTFGLSISELMRGEVIPLPDSLIIKKMEPNERRITGSES